MNDSRGIELAVGDSVVYAVRAGSWMSLKLGVIESIEKGQAAIRVELTAYETKYGARHIRRVSGVNMVKVNGYPAAS